MSDLTKTVDAETAWAEWCPLEELADSSFAAVYEVRIVRNDGSPFAVPRLLMSDERGVLSIAEAGNLENRRRQCRDAIKSGVGHSSYNLFHYVIAHTKLKEYYPDFHLQYRYCSTTDKIAAQALESQMIKDYILHFGEPPPLNSVVPDRYTGWPQPDMSGWE